MADQLNNQLWEKCESGRVEEVRQALAAGADPNARGGHSNNTCLLEATMLNHDRVVELLLSTPGIQVNAMNGFYRTALQFACGKGSLAVIAKILSSPGVQPNEKDSEGQTPMMKAILNGQTQAVLQMAAVPQVSLHSIPWSLGRSLENYATR